MQNYYEKEVLITSTYADRRCEVGIFQAGILIQDAMTEFFHQYDCDAIQMSRTHQAVWAIARTKIFMDQDILWMDRIRIKIFPVKISNVAIHLNILFESLDGHPLLRARQELCAIDSVNHTLRRIDTTPFPMDLPPMEPVLTAPCRRMKLKLGPEHQLYTHTVRTMDTDMNQHMNNTSYFRLILDTHPSSFWDTWKVQEFDIHHVNESVEGEELQICCQEEPGALSAQIKRGETTLIKAFLLLTPRESA